MMRFAFTEEQQLFRQSVRSLLQQECPPGHVRSSWSSATGRSPALWAKLAELGVVGLTVPEAYGGLGGTAIELCAILEEAGRAALPEPLLETTAVAVPMLGEVGGEELCARWLPEVAAGRAVLTVGLASMPFVADAHVADLLLLERDGEIHAVSRAAATLTPQASVDGARRLFRVAFHPGSGTCLARGEEAARAALAAFDRGALATAAVLLGIGRRMLDMTVEYVKIRRQFGRPIGSFQAVKHHLADALLKVEMASPVVHRAACSAAHGDAEQAVHVSMAKAYASDAAEVAARAALQCHGAIGYTVEHDLHLWMKRAWALAAAFGDAAFHRARVAAAVLDASDREEE
jgi:alkylation response protein AidB-like acyl-CoA dehydrogenase